MAVLTHKCLCLLKSLGPFSIIEFNNKKKQSCPLGFYYIAQ